VLILQILDKDVWNHGAVPYLSQAGAKTMQTQVKTMARSRTELQVAVEERRGEPGVWTVEAIDIDGDGEIYQVLFVGPDAKQRAYEYARFKYGLTH
jgi:hypothetical protein